MPVCFRVKEDFFSHGSVLRLWINADAKAAVGKQVMAEYVRKYAEKGAT